SRSLAVGDFNSDRLPDLAVANASSDNLSILLNTTPVTTTPPNIAISNTKITEGNKGRKNARFAVTLDNPSNETVKVNYTTADQTAKAGKDYRKTNGTLTFKPGQTKKTITVPILGDTLDEGNEKFNLNLSKPRNAKLGDRRGIGTIRDNDKVVPQLSIGDATVTEGDDGSKQAKFTVTLNAKSKDTVRVNYLTGNGTADAGEDYRRTKGTLTFKPGQRRKTITVPVLGDIIDEKNEKFQVTLSKPRNAKFRDKTGIGTIRDND
ncbi:MAG: sodium:calcium exchanger, partial [Okeania sp. SIO2H7]|nr:sodium:calcium exchanger [Okeania sp. SIO2H7]